MARDTPIVGALTAAQQRLLRQRLALLRQGDVISLGATSIIGRGPSPTLTAVDPSGPAPDDRAWSVMLVSELGWYVVLSQDCDIVRDLDSEPCLLVCPLEARSLSEWQTLRSGPYSPRAFPYPEHASLALPSGTAPVANIRFIASLDKAALLSEHFDCVSALRSATMKQRFASWVGRRFARVPHSDALEQDVLGGCGTRVRQLAKAFQRNTSGRSPAQMLVGATDEWLLAPGEQLVPFQLILTEALAAEAGLWDGASSNFNLSLIEKGRLDLQRDLSRRVTAGLGYSVTIEVHTLDQVPASTFRTWAPWTWEPAPTWTPADLDDDGATQPSRTSR